MIKILFFAHLQDEAGTAAMEIDKSGLTVGELKLWVQENHGLQGLNSVMTAVNESFANESDLINDGDTVAFIPPVSGG
ncbi:molybdopterin converting factor subunit 1 [Metabacillus idriensis]|uniref:molybdopterin converting factor subunit 1 n=1 Tax=Metabacillus idriensis TaxID=324768 RepID=UPI00281443D0|nr:molybdopterin converting factor subunit 1 [Metabacillus idriensis]MDR0137558.1 molybdopterin converting factor subunit 1 [Metabacillus idriensis]